MQRGDRPYRNFGEKLKKLRVEAHESLIEASGAVEIDIDTLETYERGEKRPSEDILHLLLTHFDIDDDQADNLWELAGYDHKDKETDREEHTSQQAAMMILPMDARIVYTDMINVTVNNYGVVINFMQTNIQSGQPLSVAKLGMSMDHARSVIDVMQRSLDQAAKAAEALRQPKQLPAPKSKEDDTSKK